MTNHVIKACAPASEVMESDGTITVMYKTAKHVITFSLLPGVYAGLITKIDPTTNTTTTNNNNTTTNTTTTTGPVQFTAALLIELQT